VLRDGNRIFTTDIARTDVGTVIRAMLGGKSSLIAAADRPHRAAATPARAGTPALELDAVCSGDLLRDIGLSVHPGEVIGLAGVLGSGRTELAEAIYGLRRIDAGVVRLNGVAANLREPKEALRHGVFLLPEDRKSEGIFGHLDVRENVILGYDPAAEAQRQAEPVGVSLDVPAPEQAAPRRWVGLAPILVQAERRAFTAMRTSLGIRCSGPDDRITSLSGGNQQKALFARAALSHPAVLFLSEPTRGVDVGAKEEIYSAIDAFAKRGIAIVVSSSEISELMRLASRIYVLRSGRIVAQVVSDETSEEEILKFMAG